MSVIRVSLFGTWQMRILGVISSPGAQFGQERLSGPSAAMGTIAVQLRTKIGVLHVLLGGLTARVRGG